MDYSVWRIILTIFHRYHGKFKPPLNSHNHQMSSCNAEFRNDHNLQQMSSSSPAWCTGRKSRPPWKNGG